MVLRGLSEEAQFSLREHFESSLSDLIAHFSSSPDLPVNFGVHWRGLTTTAFSGAVEKSPWPRACRVRLLVFTTIDAKV